MFLAKQARRDAAGQLLALQIFRRKIKS